MTHRLTRFAATLLIILAGALMPVAAQIVTGQEFAFAPLRMPFPAGPGQVIFGYGPGGHHVGNGNIYSLDLCQGDGCTRGEVGDLVLAPTDLTRVWTGNADGKADGPQDYHIFEIATGTEDRLCLALGHFLFAPASTPDDDGRLPQGTELGRLIAYVDSAGNTIPHIHIGLWTIPIGFGCAGNPDQRKALPFAERYALDGQSFPVGGSQKGPVTSSNASRSGESGSSSDESPPGNGLQPGPDVAGSPVERWRFQSDAQYVFTPAVRDGLLYVSLYNEDGGASALVLDAATGRQRSRFAGAGQQWSATVPGPNGAVLVVEGNLNRDGTAVIAAIDSANGNVLWRVEPGIDEFGTPVLHGETVYVTGGSFRGDKRTGLLLALDAETGRELWRYSPGLDDLFTPAIAGNTLYVGSFSSQGRAVLTALDAETGSERWSYAPPGMWNIDSPAVTERLVITSAFSYDVNNGGQLLALDTATGTLAWQTTPGLDVLYAPSVADGVAYAGTFGSDGNALLLAYDVATGNERWRFQPEGDHQGFFGGSPGQDYVGSPAIVGDTLYVGVGTWDADGDGALYALAASDGAILWRFDPQPAVDLVFPPAVVDGVAYAGTSDSAGAVLIAIGGGS